MLIFSSYQRHTIKSIIIYHGKTTKIATIIKTDKTKYGLVDGPHRIIGTLIHFWLEVKMTNYIRKTFDSFYKVKFYPPFKE